MTYLRISVFLAGAAVMSAEMAAPRLLAPSFGATQLIWTNIIGVILAAMTAGSIAGGRFADRWPSEMAYARALFIAGILLAAVPFASRPLLDYAAAALARQEAGLFILSLLCVSLFFAPPVFFLGMISPWAVKLAGSSRPDLGRVAGELSALGAFGSIIGTFLSSFFLLPFLGTRATILATALLLAVTGGLRAFEKSAAFIAAFIFACFALPFALAGPVKNDPGQVYEKESQYQYVQVIKEGDGCTYLYLNEGLSAHSVKPRAGFLTDGYWDHISVLPSMITKKGEPLRVLILGLAAGTMAWQLSHFYGDNRKLSIDGVEIDPEVIEAGRLFFGLDNIKGLKIYAADARPFVLTGRGPYDLIIADAFRQPYIPFYMVSREFYQSCRNLLSERGIFAINLGCDRSSGDLVESFAATFKSAFDRTHIFTIANANVPFDNHIIIGSQVDLSSDAISDIAPELSASSLADIRKTWRHPKAPAGTFVFTDDHSPIEFFTERMILRGALTSNLK